MTPPWHRHRVATFAHLDGVDHVGVYQICRCRAARMEGDRRWWNRLPRLARSVSQS